VEVRAEATSSSGLPVSWSKLTRRWGCWYREQRGTEAVIENVENGDLVGLRCPNRFTPDYREKYYAKCKSLERGLQNQYGERLHTAMLTLTCSSTDDEDNWRGPIDHLDDLLASWEAVRRALSRVLEGRRWEYLAVVEPHESGYPHIHLGVLVDGVITASQFAPVIEAHLRNSEGAGAEAHDLDDEDTVSVHRASGRGDDLQSLGSYLAAYIGGEYESEATEQPAHVQRFYSLMWATGRQWFRPSQGAQEFMQPEDASDDEESAGEWRFVGISPSGDPENDLIECEGGGRVHLRRTRQPEPPPMPPPTRGS